MLIGKLSFDEIVKLSMDKVKLTFAFTGVFLVMLLSILSGYLVNFLLGKNIATVWVNVVDIVCAVITALIVLGVAVGVAIQVKDNLSKAKTKTNVLAQLKTIFWKAIGLMIIYVVLIALAMLAALAVGQLVRIPIAGPYLMALLGVPAVIVLSFLAVYAVISGKLLLIALVENPKKGVIEITKIIIEITKCNAKKIMFNAILSILPMLFLFLTMSIILILAYLLYVFCGWYLPGMGPLLGLYLQSGIGFVYFILSLSASVIFAYFLAHLTVMAVVALYSIYLDAVKK